jgi:Mg/Co/Ni transporter MgtE
LGEGGRGRYAHLPVKWETKEAVDRVRSKMGARTYDEVIRRLIDVYLEYTKLVGRLSVRKLLCNDLSESKASVAGWVRILLSKLSDPELLPYAMEYLVPDPEDPGVYVVDRGRCSQGP